MKATHNPKPKIGALVVLVIASVASVIFLIQRPRLIASANLEDYQISLRGHVSWDNSCRITSLTIRNRTNGQAKDLNMPKPYSGHCLNGTGIAGNKWIILVDVDGDSIREFKVLKDMNDSYYQYKFNQKLQTFDLVNL